MIEIHNLQKVLGQRTVLDIPKFEVAEGEISALVGPAGSGKLTLLNLLLGKTQPTAGTVRVAGLDPRADPTELHRRVGVLFYDDGLYVRESPIENILFHCRLHGISKDRAEEVMGQVGLADQTRTKLETLPSGLQRRLALGRAILHRPSVLILVEPFARCDEASISLIGEVLRQLAEEGTTVFVLAEDAAHLGGLCDSIRSLREGRVIDAPPSAPDQAPAQSFKVPVRLEGSVGLVNPGEIYYAEAEEGRAFLHTAEGRLPTQFTLAELETRLSRSGFFRAHRAYLVNLQHVKEVIPFTRNSFSLRLDDAAGTLIPLSKSSAADLRELLGY